MTLDEESDLLPWCLDSSGSAHLGSVGHPTVEEIVNTMFIQWLITWEPAAGDAASLDAPGERLGSGKWDENTWCPPMATPAVPHDPNDRVGYSPEIEAGRLDVDDVIRPIYQEASEALGRNFEYPKK